MPPINHQCWSGRNDSPPHINALRFHHIVQDFDSHKEKPGYVLIGYACDTGVALNQGRIGAAQGPDQIRRKLANLAYHSHHPIFDAGNIQATDYPSVAQQQQALAQRVQQALAHDHIVFALGGGHDLSFGSWCGLDAHSQGANIAVINFDAHLDLRIAPSPHSGTSFYQILTHTSAKQNTSDYICIGVSASANTQDLLATANKLGVQCIADFQCTTSHLSSLHRYLENIIQTHAHIHLSIDLDVLCAEQAPAVSAPSSLGIDFHFMLELIDYLCCSGKVRIIDIAEYNPRYDIDERTARRAAQIIHHIIHKETDTYDPNAPDKSTCWVPINR